MGSRSSPHTHVYLRADNGALITKLRAACDFIRDALARGVDVALVSKEEGEAGAGFVAASFLILEHSMCWEAAVETVMRARPLNGLKDHAEFMKNVRFLEGTGSQIGLRDAKGAYRRFGVAADVNEAVDCQISSHFFSRNTREPRQSRSQVGHGEARCTRTSPR